VRRKGKTLWTSRQGGTKVGYYEAPDGENEALFAADSIAKYVREATARGEDPRAAVLYRTNSQSRLFEEAMRRYQLKYHVVGGFSFYERAEIKDLISYVKVIHNPDDSVSLLRVINTPPRGIGKTTTEVAERLALETGQSLWGAIGEAIERNLLPARSLQALKSFRELIEDARAMAAGTYAERFKESAEETSQPPSIKDKPSSAQEGAVSQGEDDLTDFEPAAFDFGGHHEIRAESSAPQGLSPDTRDDLATFDPAGFAADASNANADSGEEESPVEGFRAPGDRANTAEILKFLIDRTGYIKVLAG
jgi:DNA helicase-2/ATP-dependent DNA helicase PcrA